MNLAAGTHLDDEVVLGFVEGRLAADLLGTVDEHLDRCDSCRDLVASFARVRGDDGELLPGTLVAHYVIAEQLGAGAMGRVYAATDRKLDRRVAIKLLRDPGGARERMVREAQAMAKLAHPNVVGVLEVGETPTGVFVAMELVEGVSLDRWGPGRGATEIARVLVDVANGLAAVHAAGVVHRDVKPANVIVGRERALLADFGLARGAVGVGRVSVPAGDSRIDETSATASTVVSDHLADGSNGTAVAGTPVYMAPEILAHEAATAASDQFSFGVMAYELIGGSRPFAGATWDELARSTRAGNIAPLRNTPSWLEAAIRRCLAADPKKRWPSMAAIAAHFTDRLARRRPTVWIAAIASVGIAAVIGTYIVTHRSSSDAGATHACLLAPFDVSPDLRGSLALYDDRVGSAVDRWVAQWSIDRASACDQPVITACLASRRDELVALLEHARNTTDIDNGDRIIDALAQFPPSDCATARPDATDPLPMDPAKHAEILAIAAVLLDDRAALALGDARPVADTIDAIVARARAVDHQPTLAEALLVAADAAKASGKLDAANEFARDAVGAALRGHADDILARAWIARVANAGDRRDLAAADDLAATAAPVIDRAGAPARLVAQLLRLRALVAYNRGTFGDARALLVQARAKYAADAATAEVSQIESAIGTNERAAGDLDAAERHHRNALAIDRALRGDHHPDVARDLHNIAGVVRLRDDLDGAVKLYREALAIEDATGHTVEAGLTHNSLGLVALGRKDWPDARAEFTAAAAALGPAGHGDLAFAEHNLGIVDAATGDHAAAIAHFTTAAELYAKTIGATAPSTIRLGLDRARSMFAIGKAADARTVLAATIAAAEAAHVDWIVTDARALLAAHPQKAVPPAPVPPPTPPPPDLTPLRDVGVYGSSQGW